MSMFDDAAASEKSHPISMRENSQSEIFIPLDPLLRMPTPRIDSGPIGFWLNQYPSSLKRQALIVIESQPPVNAMPPPYRAASALEELEGSDCAPPMSTNSSALNERLRTVLVAWNAVIPL